MRPFARTEPSAPIARPAAPSGLAARAPAHPLRAAVLFLAALALAGCGRPEPRAATPRDTAGWTAGTVDHAVPGTPARLISVRTAAHPGFDRVVFEFDRRVPGYRIAFAREPVRQCGSGDPVELPGPARLVVAFRDAAAHDDAGRATVADRDRTPDLVHVKKLTLICDFEGDVSWVLAGEVARFRATPAAPARLVVDLQ